MAVKKECVILYADGFLLLLKVRHLHVFFCSILGNRWTEIGKPFF